MAELLPPGQRKRPLSPKTPSQRPRVTKRVKTGVTPHDIQKNAIAGPSTPASLTQSRISSRISRPTAKKLASIQKRTVVSESESDFDSDQSFPSNILPKVPSNAKKRKLSSISRPSPSRGKEAESKHNSSMTHFLQSIKPENRRQKEERPNFVSVVHLGAIELSSDSQDDPPVKPPKKRPKKNNRKSLSSDIIDLCSSPEETPSPLKSPTRTRMEDNVVVILSSDDESHPSANLFASEMDPDKHMPHLPIEMSPELQGQEEPEVSNRISPRRSLDENDEISIDCLQPSLNEALKKSKLKSGEAGDKVSCFTASTSPPLRIILYTPDIPNPMLHTPGFFSRAIADAKTAFLAAQKRAKRRRFEALLLASSSTKHGTSRRVSIQCIKTKEAEVSTSAVVHSSTPPIPEDAVSRCAGDSSTPATYRTEARPRCAFAASVAMGCNTDQVSESNVANDYAGMDEQNIAEPISDGNLIPFDNLTGEGAPPNIVEVQGPHDKLVQSVATASVSPVLYPRSGHKSISVDESSDEASLDGSGLSLGRSHPDPHIPKELNHVPTTSQLKVSRSISEIPEKTKLSAQCLIQVLNDLRLSKMSTNPTTPAVVIPPQAGGGSNSLADCNPNSLNGSTTSDPSEVESPPPFTPSDSPTDESLIILTQPKAVSVLDFDLNNLGLPFIMGNSKCDDDDDDLSLSGLEFMYPDDVC